MTQDVIQDAVDVVPEAVAMRANLMAASQANYDAVLTPADPGGLSYRDRQAIAGRICRLNNESRLAAHYGGAGLDGGDPRMAAMLRHVDLVTCSPKDATRADIVALQRAGVADADIVRLSQLIAFVNYQVRVVAGLRLMGAAS